MEGDLIRNWQSLRGWPLTIVAGELLLVACSAFYLVWWTITFRPSARAPSGGGIFLAGAALAGFGGLVVIAVGITTLLSRASMPAVEATIGGGIVVGALLIFVTSTFAHRQVTTELPLIIIWTTLQLTAGVTLRTAGELSPAATSAWIAAIVIATLVGLACYLAFYSLGPVPAFWVGLLPLGLDGLVAAALAALVVGTR